MVNEQWSVIVTTAWVAAVAAALAAGGVGAALRRKDVFWPSLSLTGLLVCLAPALGVDSQMDRWRRVLAPSQRVEFPTRVPPAPPVDPVWETITAPPLAAPPSLQDLAAPADDPATDAETQPQTIQPRAAGSEDLRPFGPPGQRAEADPRSPASNKVWPTLQRR